jgi:hypothetical protein
MGAITSEVGFTSATTRRGNHEVYIDSGVIGEKIEYYGRVSVFFSQLSGVQFTNFKQRTVSSRVDYMCVTHFSSFL